MTFVLDATVGGPTANSFIGLSDAQAIVDITPNSCAWTEIGSILQSQALAAATTMLNVLAYQGTKVDFLQALAWPRYGVPDPDYGETRVGPGAYAIIGQWGFYLDTTTIPRRIGRACTMLALEILRARTADVWGVDATANIASKQIDTLITQYVDPSLRRSGLRKYPSVWREVGPLTLSAQQLSVERA